MKSEFGEDLESQYKKTLAFFYGDCLKMIQSIQLSVQKYSLSTQSKKVKKRLNYYKSLLKYSLLKLNKLK